MAKSLVLALTVCFMIATVNCSLINVLKRQIMFGGTIGQITRTNNYSIPYQPLPPPQHGINFDSTTNINFNSPISQNEPQKLPSFNNNGNLKSYFFFSYKLQYLTGPVGQNPIPPFTDSRDNYIFLSGKKGMDCDENGLRCNYYV